MLNMPYALLCILFIAEHRTVLLFFFFKVSEEQRPTVNFFALGLPFFFFSKTLKTLSCVTVHEFSMCV